MRKKLIISLFTLFFAVNQLSAQVTSDSKQNLNAPSYVPTVRVGRVDYEGDSVQFIQMNKLYIFPEKEFKSKKERREYTRLVANVKKVLPIAKEANKIIIETYEYLQTLPNKKAKDAHLKLVEKSITQQYKPRMKKLTYSQGKLLIKLIYRECNSSSYDLVQAFMGPIRAGFWQAFAWAFGASLKKNYEPEGVDKETERVVLMVESGQI